MKKIKVLIPLYNANSDEYYRTVQPSLYLLKNNGSDIDITITREGNEWDIEYLSTFDVIHFHRWFGHPDAAPELYSLIQKRGVKLVLDLDDYWEFSEYMVVAKTLTSLGLYGREKDLIPLVDHVTVTTKHFAGVIKPLNENVHVLKNTLDLSLPMWGHEVRDSDKCRIAWSGSIFRTHDLKLLENSISKIYLDKELTDKFRFVLAGGQRKDEYIFKGKGFIHLPSISTDEYGVYYSDMDVCLAPLTESMFNECKSELKMVEAGFMKKAFICSNYGPYVEHIVDGKNGLLVKTEDDWYKHMKRLIVDKDFRLELADNLYNYVKANFDPEIVYRDRFNFYKSII